MADSERAVTNSAASPRQPISPSFKLLRLG